MANCKNDDAQSAYLLPPHCGKRTIRPSALTHSLRQSHAHFRRYSPVRSLLSPPARSFTELVWPARKNGEVTIPSRSLARYPSSSGRRCPPPPPPPLASDDTVPSCDVAPAISPPPPPFLGSVSRCTWYMITTNFCESVLAKISFISGPDSV